MMILELLRVEDNQCAGIEQLNFACHQPSSLEHWKLQTTATYDGLEELISLKKD